jgi:hypothetical protein
MTSGRRIAVRAPMVLEVPLITCDSRLANAPGITAELFAPE